MTRERRQWSKDQKLQIIQEVEVNGLQPTLRKYNLSQSLFHKWKRRFNEQGILALRLNTLKLIRRNEGWNKKSNVSGSWSENLVLS